MPKSITVGDVVTLRRGTTYNGRLLGGDSGPALLGLGTIARNGGFRSDKVQRYSGSSDPRILLAPGDIYVSLKDVTHTADLLGAVARVPTSVHVGRLTQDTVGLRRIDDRVSESYLYWILRTPQYRTYCRERAIGTTNLALPRADFLAFEIPAPDTERIALTSTLEAIEQKMDLNSEISSNCRKISSMHIAHYLNMRPDNPRSFTFAHLADAKYLSFSDGYRTKREELGNSGYRIVRVADIADGTVHPMGIDHVSELFTSAMGSKIGQAGDVLLTTKGTVGRVAYVDAITDPIVYSPQICWFRTPSTSPIDPFFLRYWFESREFAEQASHRMHNSDMAPYISLADIRSLRISVPSAEVMRDLAARLRALELQAQALTRQNRALADLRDTLLSQLMSGHLRVKDAEKQVGDVV